MDLLETGAADLGVTLDRVQLDQFRLYYGELIQWNNHVNLTAVTDYEQVQTRHFLDSLTVDAVLPDTLRRSGRLLDVGSGAGLPGLPLRIAHPGLNVTLLDATAKKTAFLKHITRVLGLKDVEICTGRAESLAHDQTLRGMYDVVVSRAVARLSVLSELILPFCKVGGLAVAQKRGNVAAELCEAQVAIKSMGGVVKEVVDVEVEGVVDAAMLVVIEKTAATMERYPRRPGIPSKHPL